MMNNLIRRPEHLHSKACLASAIICAVENWRDEEGTTNHSFRLLAQDNAFLQDADIYLNEGVATCTCPPCPSSCCEGLTDTFGNPA